MKNELKCNQQDRPEPANGGRTTYSPPPFVHPSLMQSGIILGSGVDSLTIAFDLRWRDMSFFEHLHKLQEEARSKKRPATGQLQTADLSHALMYQVEANGKEGYRWILNNPEWSMKLGAWTAPTTRPSAMVTLRSEALWLYGVIESIDRLTMLLQSVGGYVVRARASRVDVCTDIQLPEDMWHIGLINHRVGHIKKTAIYLDFDRLTGFTIGKGDLIARIYDKEFEIAECSHKTWMYDIWKIEKVPEGQRAIRVEFQVRREILKQLAVDSIGDFLGYPRSLWEYCTQRWLLFAVNRDAAKRDRKILPFWQTLQNGFLGGQSGAPFIRAKMVGAKRKQLDQQLMGQATSLVAMECITAHPSVRIEDHAELFKQCAERLGITDAEFSERIRAKLARRPRVQEKFDLAQAQRAAGGLPQWKTDDGKVA